MALASPRPAVLESSLLRRAGFVHGFTTRGGSIGDTGLDADGVYMVRQVHGAGVVTATGPVASLRSEEADAIVLTEGRVGAVRVADCVPVLVGDVAKGRAAAVHAGWRGVVGGVVPAALAAMRGQPSNLVAAIGPCIGPCCFEVGEDVADLIADAVPAPGVVVRRAGDKAWVDLVTAVRAQIEACGVPAASIERVGGCTRCDADLYCSYRRDGATAGRLFAVIAAREAPT